MMCNPSLALLRRWAAAWLLCVLGTAAVFAHDIPTDVRVLGFIKPAVASAGAEGTRLQLLLRVPLAAMNEVDLPLVGPGYLDLARADAALRVAAELWLADNLRLFEEDRALPRLKVVALRVSLASDRSFGSWGEALAHLRGPQIPPGTQLYWKQQHLDVLLETTITDAHARFAIEPRLARMGLQVVTALRFLPAAGGERAFQWHGNPGLVRLDPRWHQVAWRFTADGIGHILDGTDHLLFLLALVLPLRNLRALVVLATAFTLAHSLTLTAAVFGLTPQATWFAPLVEWLIALSIVIMALANLLGAGGAARWRGAFAFGLVHGFGFAFALGESLQFAGTHLATSLLAFNLGVELGQLAVLVVAVPLLNFLLRRLPERAGVIVLSALVVHQAWHWMGERWAVLAKFPWPALDAQALATALGWVMAAVVLALVMRAADRPLRRWMGAER